MKLGFSFNVGAQVKRWSVSNAINWTFQTNDTEYDEDEGEEEAVDVTSIGFQLVDETSPDATA